MLRRMTARCMAAAGVALAALGLGSAAMGQSVVISQVWGGSSTGTGLAALPKSDFVELYNRTNAAVSVNGWSLAVASSGSSSTWSYVNLSGSIPARGYFLVQLFTTPSTNGIALPTPDVTASAAVTSLASTTGKVILRTVPATTTISGTCPTIDATIVDRVTYGTTAGCQEGTTAPAGSATGSGLAVFRNEGGCADTDNNSVDFATAIPAPRNSTTTTTSACVLGACCVGSACTFTTQTSCTGTYSLGVACSTNPCVTVACCDVNLGTCTLVTPGTCAGAEGPANSTCATFACSPTGACCSGSTGSTCGVRTAVGCTAVSGFYLGNGSTCTGTPCATGACCFTNGSCCNLFSQLCTQQNGSPSASGVTCTTTTTTNCVPVPSNDACATASTLTVGATVTGHNINALTNANELNTLCSTVKASRGVWFKFTPAATSVFEISTCGSSWDNILGVWTVGNCSDPATWVSVACADDGCTGNTPTLFCATAGSTTAAVIKDLQLVGGQEYRILLASDSTSAAGNYTITITNLGAIDVGACCNQVTGQCTIQSSAACTASAPTATGAAPFYVGNGTTCAAGPCVTVGACCSTTGICVLRRPASCTTANAYQGDNSTCWPDPCLQVACCNDSTGACTLRLAASGCNTGETAQSQAEPTCGPSPCPAQGVCCNQGSCLGPRVQSACASPSTWISTAISCTPQPCTQPPLPGNDECASATALALDTPVTGYTSGSSASTTATLCTTTLPNDVYYSFQAPSNAGYVFTLTPQAISAATSMSIGSACTPFDDDLFCASASSSATTTTLALAAGQTVRVRAAVANSSTSFGVFTLGVGTSATPVGACCTNSAGACTLVLSGSCPTSSTYLGNGTLCTPSPCPANLVVTVAAPANCSAGQGGDLPFTVTVANNGAVASGPVTLTVSLPAASDAVFNTSTPAPATQTATEVTYGLASLAPAATTSVSITLRAVGDGAAVSITASVPLAGDLVAADNTASNSTIVSPSAPPAPRGARALLSDSASLLNSVTPAGGNYTAFDRPFASPNGAFWAIRATNNLGTAQDLMIVRAATGSAPILMVQEGVTNTSNGLLGTFDSGLSVSNSGVIAFSGDDAGATTSDEFVATTDGTAITDVAREGNPVLAYSGFSYGASSGSAAIFTSGQTGFSFTSSPTGGSGYFTANGTAAVVRQGVTVPTGATAAVDTLITNTSGDSGILFDASGANTLYQGTLALATTTNDSVVVANGTVVMQGLTTVLPGFTNAVNNTSKTIRMGAGGHWSIRGSNTDANEDWVVFGQGTAISRVIKVGDPIFTGSGLKWFQDASFTATFFLNFSDANGNFVVGGLTDAPGNGDDAILVYNNQAILARENDPVDLDGNGLFDDGVYINTFGNDDIAFLNDGTVLLAVTLRGADARCSTATPTSVGDALIRVPLPASDVRCCRGSTCAILPAAACVAPGGSVRAGAVSAGAGANCNTSGNTDSPCCLADYNKANNVDLLDIFAFLEDWFNGVPFTNHNGDANASGDLLDIFSFLGDWFAGPCP